MSNQFPGKCARLVTAFVLLLVGVLASGCGGGKGDVSGQVTFQKDPIPLGRITFQSQTGDRQVFTSPIDKGSYSMTGVPAGPVKVTVESFQRRAGGPRPPKDLGIKKPGSSEKAAPGKPVVIPQRYADFDASKLTYEVTSGTQTKDFDLEP